VNTLQRYMLQYVKRIYMTSKLNDLVSCQWSLEISLSKYSPKYPTKLIEFLTRIYVLVIVPQFANCQGKSPRFILRKAGQHFIVCSSVLNVRRFVCHGICTFLVGSYVQKQLQKLSKMLHFVKQ